MECLTKNRKRRKNIKKFDVLQRIDKIWSEARYVMSAVVFDVGYDTRMIKTRKNMVIVQFLAAIKEKKT